MAKGKKSKFSFSRRQAQSTPLQGSRSSTKSAADENFSQHGYYAFKLYFVDVNSISPPDILKKVSAFEEYIRNNEKEFSLTSINENKVFFVDLQELEKNDKFLSDWTDFENAIRNDTGFCLSCMGLAMHQTIVNHFKSIDKDIDCNVPFINARVMNHQPIIQLKNIKINCYNTLISLQGTVIKASNVKLLCKYITFVCSSCSGIQLVQQVDGNYAVPTKCPTKGCKAHSNFAPSLSAQSRTINKQTVKLQELVGIDPNENGRIPRTIECELTDDLVGCCIPGDDITIAGVIKVLNTCDNKYKKMQPSIFSLYVDVVSVVNNKNKSDSITGTTDRISFNTHDYYAIEQIHAETNLFRFLVNSLCPNIYGNEIVKAGFLLALFGGTNSSQDDAFSSRAVSHVLMVGDPGLGKSHILQACTNVAPRGVYVCGNTSTSSGLTVTLAKESGGDYTLEAGALILADQGHCCIDEFDKMTSQHAHLLEAMEQQSISIAKAGVTCNLAACTSILAAANPSGGHYDKSKTVSENIKMSSPLISRFDLVFLLLDKPSTQYDGLLSEHILALHSGVNKKFLMQSQLSSDNNKTLLSRLKLLPNEDMDYLPHILFRKYIAYAQKYVHPTVSLEAQELLRQFYLKLRKNCKLSNCSPLTARQLESLLRLTQARAKAELREEATVQDATDVIEIMQHSFISIFTDEYGGIDLNRSQNGSGMSKQNQVKSLLSILQEKAETLTQSEFTLKEIQAVAEEVGIQKNRFYTTLQNLNLHGYLLQRSANKYRLTTVDF